jgi:hypothetical protein
MRICIVDECLNYAPYKSGYCPKHYQRNKVHGNPLVEIPRGTRHGYRHHPLYPIWKGVKARAFNKNVKAYKNYGGRGILICSEWLDPKAFIIYLEKLPGYGNPKLSLDRIDNDIGYQPGNVRWATRVQQRNNQRKNERGLMGWRTKAFSGQAE